MYRHPFALACSLALGLFFADAASAQDKTERASPPRVGDVAPDFTLPDIDDAEISLEKLRNDGPVVLVVLRGYPGYQCPLCRKQVANLIASKKAFADKGAKVVLVYPGSVDLLTKKAKEFMGNTELPEHFTLLLDREFALIQQYGLRWDAPGETAYPATFVIGRDGTIALAVVSDSHGGRAETKKVIDAIPE
jgi:peroxiredoxin